MNVKITKRKIVKATVAASMIMEIIDLKKMEIDVSVGESMILEFEFNTQFVL